MWHSVVFVVRINALEGLGEFEVVGVGLANARIGRFDIAAELRRRWVAIGIQQAATGNRHGVLRKLLGRLVPAVATDRRHGIRVAEIRRRFTHVVNVAKELAIILVKKLVEQVDSHVRVANDLLGIERQRSAIECITLHCFRWGQSYMTETQEATEIADTVETHVLQKDSVCDACTARQHTFVVKDLAKCMEDLIVLVTKSNVASFGCKCVGGGSSDGACCRCRCLIGRFLASTA
jgi:hypothetical protein